MAGSEGTRSEDGMGEVRGEGACGETRAGRACYVGLWGEGATPYGVGVIFDGDPGYRFAPPRAMHRSSLRDGCGWGEGLWGEGGGRGA